MNRLHMLILAIVLGLGLFLLWALSYTIVANPADSGDVFCVTQDGGTYSNCTQVFSSIQAAVDAASGGEDIRVAAGIYTDTHFRRGMTQVAYITKTVTLCGGYTTTNGFATPPDPVANPTTLDAQRQGGVIYVSGDISPTIEGLRITGGAGRGIAVVTATANIRSNWIVDNHTSGFGGGLYLLSSTSTLSGNIITHNRAGNGGGVYLDHSVPTLEGNTINDNYASFAGGGLALWYSDAIVRDNVIVANNAQSSGGLTLTGSDAILSRNIISGNITFWNSCGGLSLNKSNATLINNVVIDNEGGLCIWDSSPQLLYTTFARNSGDGKGISIGGIYTYSSVVMTNTILVGHTVGISITESSTVTLRGVLWAENQANIVGEGFATVTQAITGTPAFAPDGYHLRANSAAIDRGVDTGVNNDIDGELRPIGEGHDLGADEFPFILDKYVYLPLVLCH